MSADSHPQIFISYARKDGRNLDLRLRNNLDRANYNLWLDTAHIAGGTDWALEIKEAINTCSTCSVALVLLSEDSYKPEVCRGEQLHMF